MSALSALNLVLAAVCGGLGWLAYAAYEAPPAELPAQVVAGAAPADAAAAPNFRPFRMAPPQRFSELVERPPFTQSRRPPQVSAEPVAHREAPRRDLKLSLIGVILQPDRQYALVQRPGKKEAQRLAKGEKIDGWQVEGILPDRVILSQAKEVVELELKDAKIKRPTAKRRQPRKAEAQDRRQSTAANPALRRQVPAQGQQRPGDDEGEEDPPENLRRALQRETQ